VNDRVGEDVHCAMDGLAGSPKPEHVLARVPTEHRGSGRAGSPNSERVQAREAHSTLEGDDLTPGAVPSSLPLNSMIGTQQILYLHTVCKLEPRILNSDREK